MITVGFDGGGEGGPKMIGEPLGHLGSGEAELGAFLVEIEARFTGGGGAGVMLPEFAGHSFADEREEDFDDLVAGVRIGKISIVLGPLAGHKALAEVVFELTGELADEFGAAVKGGAKNFAVFKAAIDIEQIGEVLVGGVVVIGGFGCNVCVLEK